MATSWAAQVIVLRGLRTCLAEALAHVTEAAGELYLQGDSGNHGALFSTARDAICSCADSITQVWPRGDTNVSVAQSWAAA